MEKTKTGATETLKFANLPQSQLVAPYGLDQILATFGDIHQYIGADGHLDSRWRSDFLARVTLPFPLRLSWDRSQTVTRLTCHKRLTSIYAAVFARIQERGLQAKITTFGGSFAFRPQRTDSKLSTHSWGIAIDLNPESNQQGTAGNMDLELVKVFREAGFTWGGDWRGKTRDPMHFQFCTGY